MSQSARSAATSTTAATPQPSARSPAPVVPQLQLNRDQNRASQALATGGPCASKWGDKIISRPKALAVFRKSAPSKRNESSLFRDDAVSASAMRASSRGNALHTDPFAEARPRYQPKIKKTISHPRQQADERQHFKKVAQPQRAEKPKTLVSANGLTFTCGKKTTDKKFETNKVIGSPTEGSPSLQSPFLHSQRFAASPKGKPTRGPSEASVFNPPEEQPQKAHTRMMPRGESLRGVFRPEPVVAKKHMHRPPWHTSTPRSGGSGSGHGKLHFKTQVPWHTGTPRGAEGAPRAASTAASATHVPWHTSTPRENKASPAAASAASPSRTPWHTNSPRRPAANACGTGSPVANSAE